MGLRDMPHPLSMLKNYMHKAVQQLKFDVNCLKPRSAHA